MAHQLVLLRHGQSIWNKENRFTGWVDVGLSDRGIIEAKMAGQTLKKEGLTFDVAFTSYLQRAIKTLWLSLEELDLMWIPINHRWQLNERHYGRLQGLNKVETVEEFGEKQVFEWRRSYATPPPVMDSDHKDHPAKDIKYAEIDPGKLPSSEALLQTKDRVMPVWSDEIAPMIRQGRKVIIAAHGNSLRALVKHLENISDEEINNLNIPTGIPLLYHLDESLKPVEKRYLGDPESIAKATHEVAHQTKA